MLITVIIESMFTGSASGFTQVVVDDSEPVQTIINKFCDTKGAPVDPDFAIFNDANISFDAEKRISEYRVQDNDHLRLGRRRAPSQMFRFVNWYRLATVGTALGLFGLIGSCLLYVLLRDVPFKYGVVFDAGSTHTSATVYHWPGGKYRGTGRVKELTTCAIHAGGIADVPPENVSSYLSKCILGTKNSIPSELLYEAEVYFGATAGMRILEEKNSSAAESILEKVRDALETSGFVYDDSNVNIIPGEREGLTGWISVNFLNNSLKDSTGSSTEALNETIGSLDLGGASVQIAVETEIPSNKSLNPHVYPVTLFDHNYTVYTQSFLCYGRVQAMNRYRALLVLDQANSTNASISSPCDPKGKSYEKRYDEIFGVPCAPLANSSVTDWLSNKTFTFHGASDNENCNKSVSALLSPTSCEKLQSSHCLNTSRIPKEVLTSKFMAFSTFGHTVTNLKLPHRGSMQDFLARFTRLCENSYDELMFIHSTFQPQVPLDHLEELCFSGYYVYTLLTTGFGFTKEEDWNRIDFRNKANDVSVGWAIGFMVNETVYTSQSNSLPELDMITFTILLIVFSLVLLFGFLFLFHAKRLDRQSATTYESMNPHPSFTSPTRTNLETIKIISKSYPVY